MFLLKSPHTTLVGSSPEIMVRVEDGEVTIRPLAGTRKRGATDEEDKRLEQELLADPKERAEHVMLVDLARNDVGRVAQYGSVKLSDVMTVERYSHVMHITSNVHGTNFWSTADCADGQAGSQSIQRGEAGDELALHVRGDVHDVAVTLDRHQVAELHAAVLREKLRWRFRRQSQLPLGDVDRLQ